MADSIIVCPNCRQNIPLTSAIEGPIAERLRAEFEASAKGREAAILEGEKKVVAQRAALESARAEQEAALAGKLKAEREKLAAEAKVKAEAQLAAELGELRGQIGEQAKKLEAAQTAEIELRQQRRELEEQKAAMKLEVSRQVDAECGKVKALTQKAMEEEFSRKEKAKDETLAALSQEVAAAQRRAQTLAEKEKGLADEMAKLEEAQRSLQAQVAEKVRAEREIILAQAKAQAQQTQAIVLQDLQTQLAEKEQKLADAQRQEVELRKKGRELDEQRQELELKTARTIDEEREKIRAAAVRAADEAHRLKEKEAELQLASMRQQINDLKQKAEQGSQQLQGEALELELEAMLRAAFPLDQIVPVAKGVHGGDVVHRVMTAQLQHCGTILWESKRTKSWSDGWIDKLKMDQRAAKADVAVIVSIAMPRNLSHMGNVEGVWVASRECMMGMVLALRDGLLKMADAKRAEEGKHEKMEVLYAYFSGHEFKQRVEAIKEAFVTMREELEQEKRAMTKIWAKREKQLERVMASAAGMHGDLAGIIGRAMPEIEAFTLQALAQSEAIAE